jgi:26S proteasome regulatory subunit N6
LSLALLFSNAEGVADVINKSRAFMSSTAKAKTAKLSTCHPTMTTDPEPLTHAPVRTLLDFFNAIPNSRETQIHVLQTNIEWAKQEKRIFLKHSLETRLVGLYAPSSLLPRTPAE